MTGVDPAGPGSAACQTTFSVLLNFSGRPPSPLEPKDGKVVWSGDLETRAVFEASPTAADNKIYMMDHRGAVFVVSANPEEFKLLSTAEMGDPGRSELRSSIAIAHGALFIRTGSKLFCIGGEKKAVASTR